MVFAAFQISSIVKLGVACTQAGTTGGRCHTNGVSEEQIDLNSSSINLFGYGFYVLVGLISGHGELVWVQVLLLLGFFYGNLSCRCG